MMRGFSECSATAINGLCRSAFVCKGSSQARPAVGGQNDPQVRLVIRARRG